MSDQMTPEKVYQAAQILNLDGKAALQEIKDSHRRLIKKWHPDNCSQDNAVCKEKTEEINQAYEIIKKYCQKYRYSFEKDDIINNLPLDIQMKERWKQQFANDPHWT